MRTPASRGKYHLRVVIVAQEDAFRIDCRESQRLKPDAASGSKRSTYLPIVAGTRGAASSLSRPVSSSGLMTSCRYRFALRLMTPHGALASLRGRRAAAACVEETDEAAHALW